MLQNKRFQSNETQEIVTVMADNGVFYNLSNGANIKKDIFFQKYSEMVDATNFFQQQSAAGLQSLTEQMKSLDTRNVPDIGGQIPPTVKYRQEAISEQVAAPPEYREMLLRRFEQEQSHKDLSQYKVYENDDDAANDFERRTQQAPPPTRPRPQPPQQQYQEPQYQQPQQPYQEPQYQEPQYQQPQGDMIPSYVSPEEESFKFFKSFNKIYPIKLSVDFDEKIAEPGFIKMMAVNYKGDIIKFYTKEFMNRIYNDPGFLENKIYDKLREIVFMDGEKKEKKPRTTKATKKPSPAPKKKITIPPVPKQDRERLGPGVE